MDSYKDRVNGDKIDNIITQNLLISQIKLGQFTPRQYIDENYIKTITDSIAQDGQIKPIIVRINPVDPAFFDVIDGENRIRALLRLGKNEVRAEIHSLSDDNARVIALKANQMRGKALTPLDEGLQIKKIIEKDNWSQERIAEKLKKSQSWVSRRLSLVTKTSNELRAALITRGITKSAAREIVKLPVEDQPMVLEKVQNENLSSRETELLINILKRDPSRKNEILIKPVSTFVPLPQKIQDFEEKYSAEQVKFEEYSCPQCGLTLVVNWVLQRIGLKIEERS